MKRPLVIFLSGAALLLVVVLRGILDPSVDRLPGIDSGNIYAWEVYTRSVLADWKLPFWNPYHYGGHPSVADPQSLVFAPAFVAWAWLGESFGPTQLVGGAVVITGILVAQSAR